MSDRSHVMAKRCGLVARLVIPLSIKLRSVQCVKVNTRGGMRVRRLLRLMYTRKI